jgi:hypothetical protein
LVKRVECWCCSNLFFMSSKDFRTLMLKSEHESFDVDVKCHKCKKHNYIRFY